MKNIIIPTSFLFLSLGSHAQDLSNDVVLTIVPHICVAPRGENSCISTIDISWTSKKIGSYCLESDLIGTSLQCWKNNNSGFYQHKLIFDKNINYMMNDELTKITLANAIMKFKSLKPHRKYKKRKSRFPWSLGNP